MLIVHAGPLTMHRSQMPPPPGPGRSRSMPTTLLEAVDYDRMAPGQKRYAKMVGQDKWVRTRRQYADGGVYASVYKEHDGSTPDVKDVVGVSDVKMSKGPHPEARENARRDLHQGGSLPPRKEKTSRGDLRRGTILLEDLPNRRQLAEKEAATKPLSRQPSVERYTVASGRIFKHAF